MRRKGSDFKRASHLTFRPAQERDLQQHKGGMTRTWEPSQAAYCVIVPISRCLDANGDFDRAKRDAAECLPFDGWSRTNMVYGHGWRKQTRGARFWTWLSDLPAEDRANWLMQNAASPEICRIFWNDDKTDGRVAQWFDTYWTTTTYWVEDGRVYTATGRRPTDPALEQAA
jgi:hypothetical protein